VSKPFSRRQVVTGRLADYERTVYSRPVTITCAECGRQETREQLPGPPPRYCSLPATARCAGRWSRRARTPSTSAAGGSAGASSAPTHARVCRFSVLSALVPAPRLW
jgi:hypothetical protein